ncbi:hypothetical protein [Acinetobacter sp. ABJ_C5_2]|uniref:hypothetical protein n=1 Tax=Acinetobacter sp. ABJ_C5_2 TaxID=3376992 RepID=UPI0037C941B5
MTEKKSIFANYKSIVEDYIKSLYRNDHVFSSVVNDKLNPNYQHLKEFFKLIGVQPDLEKHYSIAKAMLSAREGKVIHLDYPHFKNVAHYVLDFIPEYWKHFRLVLKIYTHQELIGEILKDKKIQIKIEKKKSFIENPSHLHNTYIEFLCPEFNGRLISWGQGLLDSDQIESIQASYPINIFKNLLKENPELPLNPTNHEQYLELIRRYFLFSVKVDEDIPSHVLNTIFDFIHNVVGDNHSHSLFNYYGEFRTDILFKNYLNAIVDIFDLEFLIDDMGFGDNVCSITLKNNTKHSEDDLELVILNMEKYFLLREAIKWCEKKTRVVWNDFFVEVTSR